MVLDERSTSLLKELLLNPGIKIAELQKKLNITRYQVNYSLSKIDDWLSENKLPLMEKNRQTGIYVEQVVQGMFPELVKETPIYDFVFSDLERGKLIILMLLVREESYSLYHLSSSLKVSRNTILNDMKVAGTMIEPAKLKIVYTRKDGYYIEGSEFEKRQIMIKLVHQLLQTPIGKYGMEEVLDVAEEVQEIRQRLEKIEQRLKVRFTDEKLEELPYTLVFILRRIRQKKSLEMYYSNLLHTEEYKAVDELLVEHDEFDEKELLFITLQLLASSLSSTEFQEEKEFPSLMEGIIKVIDSFEKLACVNLQEKDELSKRLYLHLKPALYRIKYQLMVENPLLESVLEEHGELHFLVKKAVVPLEEMFGVEIPENECAYLTMLLGSWLLHQGVEISKKKIAIVVCLSGISVSKLLYESLKELFPDIVFLDHISLRSFIDYPYEYDLVFSTTFLRTNKKLFLVKPLLSNDEKYRLKVRVYQEINGYIPSSTNLDELIELIKHNAKIQSEDLLKKSLQEFFMEKQSNVVIPEYETMKPSLEEVMKEDAILIGKKTKTWQEAVRLASSPLLESMSITSGYVDEMIHLFENANPYIIIAPKVAIPHARPEDGVNRLTMSLLKLDEDVDFNGKPVRIFIILAAIDRSTHLKALAQLIDLVSEEENVQRIIASKSKFEILSLIKQYSRVHKISSAEANMERQES